MTESPIILDLLRRRTSERAVDPAPLSDTDLHAVLEAARWAPSWGNRQPWRLVLVRDPAARAAVAAALTRGNAWARRAPAFVVIAADPADSKSREGESYYLFDCGLVTECLLLEATRRGLIAHPIGGWDQTTVRAAIEAPETTRIVVIVVLGRPGTLDDLDERTREKDCRPRERKSLAEIAYADRWDTPISFGA